MTKSDMIEKLARMAGVDADKEEDVLSDYLDTAAYKILNRCYPFGFDDDKDVPKRYLSLQIDIALFLFNKRGAEGETYHFENGVNRMYENSDVPETMLRGITPCGVIY